MSAVDSSSVLDRAERRELTTRDGVKLHYEVLGAGDRTVLLANGLGGRLYSWKPLLEALGHRYRFVTWDYRGLFESPCDTVCRLSVRDHAEDGLEVLDAEGVRKAAWVGWSMGVQVSLEAASIAQHRFAGLVLLNGTYGHVFSSAMQPGFRVPIVPRYMHEVLEFVRARPFIAQMLARMSNAGTYATLGLFWLMLGRRAIELRPMLEQYTNDVYKPENFPNFLRLFQELDAHSAFHHLPRLRLPALVVSGRFDVLTPPYQSREIARRLKNAEHIHIRNGSHFVLIERPSEVIPHIERFLDERVVWS